MTERLDEGYRSVTADIHDVDEKAHTVAVDFPHETVDAYRTDFGRGCFDDSFRSRLPVMLVEHDRRALIGHATSAEGLGNKSRVVGQFSNFDDVPLAREYFAHIRDGDIPPGGWSFHFRNARSISHPSVRGGRRFTQAEMPEFGPTVYPAIPGVGLVSLRSQEATMEIPTLDQILKLKADGLVDDEGVRSLIVEHHPHLSEHIKISTAPTAKPALVGEDGQLAEGLRTIIAEEVAKYDLGLEEGGTRAIAIAIHHDGTVTDGNGDAIDGSSDAGTLAQAVDAALDAACDVIDGVDTSGCPEEVQQALALAQAASVAVDELLEVMGVPDADGGDDDGGRSISEAEMDAADGDRALLGTADRNDLPDSDFAYIEPGGTMEDGKTTPRSKRHFPIQDAAHVRNALARIGQGAAFADQAKAKVEAAAKKLGIDGDRSREDRVRDALAKVDRRVASEA